MVNKKEKYLTKKEALEIIKLVKNLHRVDKQIAKEVEQLKELMAKKGILAKLPEEKKPVYVS